MDSCGLRLGLELELRALGQYMIKFTESGAWNPNCWPHEPLLHRVEQPTCLETGGTSGVSAISYPRPRLSPAQLRPPSCSGATILFLLLP